MSTVEKQSTLISEEIYFESIDVTLAVKDIYYQVENVDMLEFLESKKKSN